MKPKVKFKLNKTLDEKIAFDFLEMRCAGVDFSRGIINVHPALKKIRKLKSGTDKKQLISHYFNSFYEKHQAFLKRQVAEFNQIWEGVENRFLEETDKIFKSYPFPRGKYIGYLSIVDCNPRFLDDKTFQVFYLYSCRVRYVTAHELLHFIFYDYVIKKHPNLFGGMDTERGLFWDLAEIFNVIILSEPNFVEIHGVKKRIFYPEHQNYLTPLTKAWREDQDVDRLITKAFNLLSEKCSLYRF